MSKDLIELDMLREWYEMPQTQSFKKRLLEARSNKLESVISLSGDAREQAIGAVKNFDEVIQLLAEMKEGM